MMTRTEALSVCVPFGPCHGWPLEAVKSRRPRIWRRLVAELRAGRLYGEFAEAMRAAAGEELEKAKRAPRRRRPAVDLWTAWMMR
jgi:hypothetical protein